MGKQKKGSAEKGSSPGSLEKSSRIVSESNKKKEKGANSTKKRAKQPSEDDENENGAVLTMDALRAMSDSDTDGELPPEEEWDEEAKSLKNAIEKGLFNKLLTNRKSKKEEDDDSIEEVILDDMEDTKTEDHVVKPGKSNKKVKPQKTEKDESDDDDSEDDDEDGGDSQESLDDEGEENLKISKDKKTGTQSKEDEASDESKEDEASDDDNNEIDEEDHAENEDSAKSQFPSTQHSKISNDNSDVVEDESNDEKSDEEEENEDDSDNDNEKPLPIKALNVIHQKALRAEADQLLTAQKKLTWPETFDVTPATPLPFDREDEEGNKIDIHDDLKREIAFYNAALEGVLEGRRKCEAVGIPFSRPDDFFAEMVKTDEHMARIKDRLIFENKKIEAVNQRKANKEQKLRSKESQATRLAEKAKRKKDNLKAVDDWAKAAASKRNGGQLDNFDLNGRGGGSPNKKRMAADKRYGFGGKNGRFKQTDSKTLNDLSGYHAKGNFKGGMKRKSSPAGGSGMKKRPGKRAREAGRSRQK